MIEAIWRRAKPLHDENTNVGLVPALDEFWRTSGRRDLRAASTSFGQSGPHLGGNADIPVDRTPKHADRKSKLIDMAASTGGSSPDMQYHIAGPSAQRCVIEALEGRQVRYIAPGSRRWA